MALGDLDGDGDLDAVVGTRDQDRLYSNLTRHVAWRGLPRTGYPLTIDVYGSPRGIWLLDASLRPADIPTPLGTLRLDPTLLIQAGAGVLDPSGHASLAYVVPDDQILVGVSVYRQAIVTVPLALTNLEITTFTNL